ncbi:hypothetical protein EB796_005611 [Bugula neritina]|uniref:ShKT domain-containing protein n=1 Tax=Bugula neritina TaxID=10212 RepID=A0A7J7KDU0_BUGNE|nr:hypothetical protein EB796_005611 [Bugula neritina]
MSTYCPGWERYCEEPAYSSYLSMNCMKTCGTCTASDVAIKPSTTTQPPIIQAGCADKDPKCPDYQNKCMISLRLLFTPTAVGMAMDDIIANAAAQQANSRK